MAMFVVGLMLWFSFLLVVRGITEQPGARTFLATILGSIGFITAVATVVLAKCGL